MKLSFGRRPALPLSDEVQLLRSEVMKLRAWREEIMQINARLNGQIAMLERTVAMARGEAGALRLRIPRTAQAVHQENDRLRRNLEALQRELLDVQQNPLRVRQGAVR